MKSNNMFFNILPRLYSNIICKNLVKLFQKIEVVYIQTCTSLESRTIWHPKGGHRSVLSPTSGQVQVLKSKGSNTFVHRINGLGYWNQEICYHFFLHVHLCWCICALRIYFSKIVWSVVTNKISNFFIHSLILYDEK
jgi:hypothetical protein